MVCDGPDPPENNPHDLPPPPRHDLMMNGPQAEDSDDEHHEHFGYQPLAQGPDTTLSDHDNSDEDGEVDGHQDHNDVPTIEPMDALLSREVWNSPRPTDPIQMDNERAQQVMSAMANFALPQTSIPDWAQSISEEQWKQTLSDRIEKMKENRLHERSAKIVGRLAHVRAVRGGEKRLVNQYGASVGPPPLPSQNRPQKRLLRIQGQRS